MVVGVLAQPQIAVERRQGVDDDVGVVGDAGTGGGDLGADEQEQRHVSDAALTVPGAVEQPETGRHVRDSEHDPGERAEDGVATQAHGEQQPIGVEGAAGDLGEGRVQPECPYLHGCSGLTEHLADLVGQSSVALRVGEQPVVVSAGPRGDDPGEARNDDETDQRGVHTDQQTDHRDDPGQ